MTLSPERKSWVPAMLNWQSHSYHSFFNALRTSETNVAEILSTLKWKGVSHFHAFPPASRVREELRHSYIDHEERHTAVEDRTYYPLMIAACEWGIRSNLIAPYLPVAHCKKTATRDFYQRYYPHLLRRWLAPYISENRSWIEALEKTLLYGYLLQEIPKLRQWTSYEKMAKVIGLITDFRKRNLVIINNWEGNVTLTADKAFMFVQSLPDIRYLDIKVCSWCHRCVFTYRNECPICHNWLPNAKIRVRKWLKAV